MWKLALTIACLLFAVDAAAQTEADLRAAFEGKEVLVKIDMPGSSEGVDIYPQRKPTLKADEYMREKNRYGVSIRKGATTMITKVRVRDEHIEFQLGGGGASTGGFPTGLVFSPQRSRREVELESKVDRTANETAELEAIRKKREDDQKAAKEQAAKAEAARRASEGSRFNIRYETKLTAAQMTPDAVRLALQEYVQFELTAPAAVTAPPPTGSTTNTAPAGPATPPKDPQAERKTKPLVVMITGKIGEDDTIGAGFIVGIANDRMYIATANHVVRSAGKEISGLRVLFDWLPGEWTEAKLLDSADSNLDLAVIAVPNVKRLSADHLVFDRLAPGAPAVQQGVLFIGYGDSVSWHTRRAPDVISRLSGETIYFQSAFVRPGDSGGILVSEDWRIVGMLRSISAGESNALAVARILDKLREWNYPVALK